MSTEVMKRIKSLLQDTKMIDSHTISAVVAECDMAILAQQPATGEPVAWMHWLNGPVRVFMNKDVAMMELDRLNREYPLDADDRKMRPLVFGDTAQQPATGEPVAWMASYVDPIGNDRVYVTSHRDLAVENDMHGEPKPLYTRPAPSVPKDDQIAALVNKVRDIARMFHDHQSLRERIAVELVPALKASQEVKSNAERWRYAIADGGNQSMNFIDIFGDWDGDGDFVEVFDAARLADKKGGAQ